VDWLVPWYSIQDDPAQIAAMEQQLRRELGPGHHLYGLPVQAVGRRQGCDDVLFTLVDGTSRVAVVHLTWTRNPPERPPWPETSLYSTFSEWVTDCMRPDHEDFDE
jgi:hypothetical protein